jgi:hypothetical protein
MNRDQRYFVISVDTEADIRSPKNELKSIAGIPFLQDLANKNGFYPTYLVSYEVAVNGTAAKILLPYIHAKRCEIGHHLHIWTTPPFENKNEYGIDEKWFTGLQSELPEEIFRAKMNTLHAAIKDNFNVTPTTHRAGRWGMDHRTMDWLENSGYTVDSSLCAGINWTPTKGIKEHVQVNSYSVSNAPYFPEKTNLLKSADGPATRRRICEVPVSGIPADWFGKLNFTGINTLINYLYKIGYKGIIGNKMFRPVYKMPEDVFRKMTLRLLNSDTIFVNFMLHSNELRVGTSPYSKTEPMFEVIRKRIEWVVRTAKEFGFKGLMLKEIPDLIKNG